MHILSTIAERMRETMKIGYVDYAHQYLQAYHDEERDPDRLAWMLAANAEYNEKYRLLEESLLDLLPLLNQPINILMALLDSNLGWDDNTNELFILYTKTLSKKDRESVYKVTGSKYQALLM